MTTTKTITGQIEDVAFKIGTGGEYVEVKVLEQGKAAPLTYRSFDDALIKQFKDRKGGKGLLATFQVTDQHGTWAGKPITYHNIIAVGPPIPPAGKPAESEPFPVAGATRERPQTTVEAPARPPAPQEATPAPPKPETRPSLIAASYRYSRTYNLGQFKSERFELEVVAPHWSDGAWSDAEVYASLRERIEQARAALPADTSARAVARKGL